MTHTIYTNDGTEQEFVGPVAMRVSTTGTYPQRYLVNDENNQTEKVIEVPRHKLPPRALSDHGYEIIGRVKQDTRLDNEWGYTFALEHVDRERGFRAEILTGPTHSPNGGLSARAQYVTIVGANVPDEMRTSYVTSDAPAVRMSAWPHRFLVPAEKRTEDLIGPMASGAFVYSSDSRWMELTSGSGPLALHDRYETAAQYNALSS